MSAPGPDFAKQQQDLASKPHAQLEDHEKITLMRQEIDHLRNVIRDQNDGSLQSASRAPMMASTQSTSSSSSSSSRSSAMDRAPVLTLFLFVGLLVVAIWRRRRQRTTQGISNDGGLIAGQRQQQGAAVMTFELQDSLAGYEAPGTNTHTANNNNNNNNNTMMSTMINMDPEAAHTFRI